ncbi:Hypothetical predicted protein [Mytilus galloprovincialis]|uniref:Uncharacterized protein n=1 Tax=Mytilus galloprovincialis TaxID=29158 RepID=A0A8B6C5K0_MYTGA|nr:Hypothetical predicted protein [Mytilus galloprovincialis]
MDDSDVISFKPHLDNREDDEETLPENNFESSPVRMSGSEGATDIMVAETRLEMRRFLDHCMSDFTNRMQEMLSNFETRLVSTISSKPSENSSRDVYTLALDSFIDAIPETEVRLRFREVGPKSINEAENIAVRLEALRVTDIQKSRNDRIVDTETVQEPKLKREINEIKQSIESLTSEVIIIKNQNDQQFRGDDYYRRNQNNSNRNFNNRRAFRR